MKKKIITVGTLLILIYSCASKSKIVKTDANIGYKQIPDVVTLTPELEEGKILYNNNCAKCHELYHPKEFSAEEWKPIILRMQNKADLDDSQGMKIYNYVTMN